MSIVPQSGRSAGLAPAVRTFMFWILMVVLAVMFWQMVSKGHSDQGSTTLSYSNFMNEVDGNNIQTANVQVMQNTAEVSGTLKQGASSYRTTIPRDTLPDLLAKLRQQATDVHVTEGASQTWVNFLAGVAPIILLVGLWIFMMRMQTKQRSSPPNQPTQGALG